jgi:hypothetical protein
MNMSTKYGEMTIRDAARLGGLARWAKSYYPAGPEINFDRWWRQVERVVINHCIREDRDLLLSQDEEILALAPEWYKAGLRPAVAARRIIRRMTRMT